MVMAIRETETCSPVARAYPSRGGTVFSVICFAVAISPSVVFSHRGENDNDLASGLLFFDAALCYIADVRKICDGASAKFHYSQHNSFDLFPF